MECAVITPIGPGHDRLLKQCQQSVRVAIQHSLGPFSKIHTITIDDSTGQMGSSAARNKAVRDAHGKDVGWVFFLDADDILMPGAFDCVKKYVDQYDAIWGNIVEVEPPATKPTYRIPQVLTMQDLRELLFFSPYLTLQVGHFVRTEVALNNPFEEAMEAGADFDYYLRVWQSARCIKISQPIFVKRHGFQSAGFRAPASKKYWQEAVEKILEKYRIKHDLLPGHLTDEVKELVNQKTMEFVAFARNQEAPLSSAYFKLSRSFPYYARFEVACYECDSFSMFSDNDDLVVNSIVWTGSFEPMSLKIWARLARGAASVLDIGSYTGVYAFVAARQPITNTVYCLEPLGRNVERLSDNIAANKFENVVLRRAAATSIDGEIDLQVFSDGDFLTSGSSTKAKADKAAVLRQTVKAVRVDTLVGEEHINGVDLVKIDVEGAELDVLQGMKETIGQYKPDILLEVLEGASSEELSRFLRTYGYRFYEIREDQELIKETPSLTCSTGLNNLNRLASVRSEHALEAVLGVANKDYPGVSAIEFCDQA